MIINPDKYNYIIFCPQQKNRFIDNIILNSNLHLSLNNQQINWISSTKYLGIQLSYNLSWQPHVTNITKITSVHLGILGKLRHYLPRSILLQYYYANIQSYLIYGIVTWGSTYPSIVNNLEVVINKATRIMCFKDYNENVDNLKCTLGISTFRNLWLRMTSICIYKVVNNLAHNSSSFEISYRVIDSNVGLRSGLANEGLIKLCEPNCRTNFMFYLFNNVNAKLWNHIIGCEDISKLSLHQFKIFLKKSNNIYPNFNF